MSDKKKPPTPPTPPAPAPPFDANELVQTWWGQPSPSGPAHTPATNTREAIERVRKALESKSKVPAPAAAPAAETPAAPQTPETPEPPEAPEPAEPAPAPEAEPSAT